MFSSSEGYNNLCGGYHEDMRGTQYIGGYHEYIGGYLVHWRDTMMNVGAYHDSCGGRGYHQYIRGCSVHWGFEYK